MAAFQQGMRAFGPQNPATQQAVSLLRSAVAAHIPSVGEAVFNLLPEGVKALLAGGDYETIFLAPCSATINLPFEMIHIPARRSSNRPYDDAYVGLRRLIVRTHGLSELAGVLLRQPAGRKALVVGNPLHH